MVALHTNKPECVLILPDMHYPYQDDQAIAVVKAAVRALRPSRIVLLGDNLDGAAFSSHPSRTFDDAAPSFLGAEVAPLNALLDDLQGRNNRELIYCEGNHEQRIERQCLNAGKAGRDLFALASPRRLITERVDANGRAHRPRKNLTWVPYYGRGIHSHYLISPTRKHSSALAAIHGWSHAKNAAAQVLAAARDISIVFGHTHREECKKSRHRIGPRKDITVSARSFGCLRDFYASYTAHSPNDWTHGFGVAHIYQDSWSVSTVEIARDGSAILPNGKRVVG